jgi:hypothetical protein
MACGYRMLIGFRSKLRAVFLFGFAKNELDNIDDDQLAHAAGNRRAVDRRRRPENRPGPQGWTLDRGAT